MNKTAYIFDFDDTLIYTSSLIYVRHKDTGEYRFILPTKAFNAGEYILKDDEYFDFDEFTDLSILSNEQTTPIFEIFKACIKAGYDCFILTNRQFKQHIRQFLGEHSVTLPDERIICTNAADSKYLKSETTDPMRKLAAISDLYDQGYTNFNIWEDSITMRDSIELMCEKAYDVNITFHNVMEDNDTDMVDENFRLLTPNDNIKGKHCSFHDITFNATPEEIKNIFGKANAKSGDQKSNYIWDFISADGESFISVYDWKLYRQIEDTEDIEWHIGGPDAMTCVAFKDFIYNKLHE